MSSNKTATDAAAGKSPTWPNGEPRSVRDAYDAKYGPGRKPGGKK